METVTCHQCGDGPLDGCEIGGVTLYLCQDCHEKEVDADFWAMMRSDAGIEYAERWHKKLEREE
jgi:hypothetical protein